MDCKILIVEDEAKLREVLCDYFLSKGERPVEAGGGLEALERLEEEAFDAVLLDIMMPGWTDSRCAGRCAGAMMSPSCFSLRCPMRRTSCWGMSWGPTTM